MHCCSNEEILSVSGLGSCRHIAAAACTSGVPVRCSAVWCGVVWAYQYAYVPASSLTMLHTWKSTAESGTSSNSTACTAYALYWVLGSAAYRACRRGSQESVGGCVAWGWRSRACHTAAKSCDNDKNGVGKNAHAYVGHAWKHLHIP